MVYVWVRQGVLRDRVAAVSERVAEVANGEPLEVLEHGRRFLKVKTARDQIGWIQDRAVIDAKTYDSFLQLASQHRGDPVVATASLNNDLYMHLLPGRKTDRFYLLAGDSKVQLLARASIPEETRFSAPAPARSATQTPRMEDWWLARDGHGHTGWLLARDLYVDVPDAIGIYSEGQQFVGAYLLDSVFDPQATTPNHEVPQYVALLAPPSSGLPFDFDQVRVFTWSLNHHRYETAFRLRPIEGYLPVRISSQPEAGGNAPVFSFQIAGSSNLITDPATGVTRPAVPRTISYVLIGNRVERTGSDLRPISTDGQEGSGSKSARKAPRHRRR
ncbi:MAG: SH3 domain-containing protein [Terracidiphilus sp.]